MLPYASPVNPVDATAQAVTDLPLMTRYVESMLSLGGYDLFAGILGSLPSQASYGDVLGEALGDATEGHGTVIRALTMAAPREVVRRYEERGFLVFEDGAQLTNALGALARFRANFDDAKKGGTALALPGPASLPDMPLSEHGAKVLLAAAGVTFPGERLVSPGGDVAAAAREIGFPVVLKICSPDILHKTEVGGVIVNIRDEAGATAAAETLLKRAAEAMPAARIEGVLVCPMISGGVETIIGVMRDPVFGPVVMFGLGGVLVEVLKDVTFRLAPFGLEEAHHMIREIRGYKVLEGARGAPPADVDALAEMLSRLSLFAAANADRIASIDLNPVLIMPKGQGVCPLDALVELVGSEAAVEHV
jgi:acyl-CoA synthetase (NDP forming)